MNVNLISGTTGAQGATNAANATGADAALFQNLIAAALLQKGGAGAGGTEALTPDALSAANASEAEGAELALLMKLLLGGGAFTATNAMNAADAEAAQGSLLAAIAGTPAEELLAASGKPNAAESAELLAETTAIADALTAIENAVGAANAAIAADGAANGFAVETLLSNAEAAHTPLSAALADALKPLLESGAVATGAADAPKAVLPAAIAGASAEELLAASGEPDIAKAAELLADAVAATDAQAARTAGDGSAARGVPADAIASNAAATAESVRAPQESGAASEAHAADATNATGAQDGIAARGTEASAQAARGQSAERLAPYGQIAREVFAALAGKNVPTTLSMRLEPAELGRIDVSMKLTSAGKLVIDIAAESARTQALLAGQTDKLVQALGLQNVQVESVSTAGPAFGGQQLAQGYADRSMAFFMDLASGDREKNADRDGGEQASHDGRVAAGIPAEETTPEAVRYARRLDLTA
ncbi:MAG: flagellar hook-length control protein FliK [Clostridiales Family XIII bacterium]|nr:flagellar hook-length control protein FliK [Clostridiales Family XIII bacterium]